MRRLLDNLTEKQIDVMVILWIYHEQLLHKSFILFTFKWKFKQIWEIHVLAYNLFAKIFIFYFRFISIILKSLWFYDAVTCETDKRIDSLDWS